MILPNPTRSDAVSAPAEDRAGAIAGRNDPFFIVGVHRSGTTLLRYMLSSSPRVYVPPESDFIPRFFGDPTSAVGRARAQQILNALFGEHRYRLFARDWKGDRPTVSDLMGPRESIPAGDFLCGLYDRYAAGYGAVRWGDKTPVYTDYMDLLHRLLPTARFVHIYRDGRDAALSMVEKWGPREWHIDLYQASWNWVRRLSRARRAGRRLGPEYYTEVRYETLVADPESELRRVCAFLGEPYHEAMTRPQETARRDIEADNPFHQNLRRPPNEGQIGRWRHRLSTRDQRLMQRVAGRLLEELGYPLEDLGPMTAGDWARYSTLKAKHLAAQGVRRGLQAISLIPPN